MGIKYFDSIRLDVRNAEALEGELRITHSGIEDGYYSKSNEKVAISIAIPRPFLADKVFLTFYNAHSQINVSKKEAIRVGFDYLNDFYFVEYAEDYFSSGLYFFSITVVGKDVFYSKNKNGKLVFCKENNGVPFQLTVTERDEAHESIGGIIYHVFVDRFRRGGKQIIPKEALLIEDWGAEIAEYPEYPGAFLKNNTFYGGTLYGIAEKMEYISSLGASYIYLSPIFESPSNHKYDTANYFKIDGIFGGEEAFSALINQANKYGIGVILDGVFNHTGADSIYFNKFDRYKEIGAYNSPSSEYFSWFDFQEYPEKYTCWWGIDILPRINYEKSSAKEYMLRVISHWLKYGISGFRLDVADELSDDFIADIHSTIKKYNPNGLLYGEVWEDASAKIAYGVRKKYYLGAELDGVMNYPLRDSIIDYVINKNAESMRYYLNTVMKNMPKPQRENAMNLLGTHDTKRILNVFADIDVSEKSISDIAVYKMSSAEYEKAKRRLVAAYTVISALPGIPTVYYGDEVGLEGFSDPFNRKTFPWGAEDVEILTHYRKIGKIRKENSIIQSGDYREVLIDNDIYAFKRHLNGKSVLLVYNNSPMNVRVEFNSPATELISERKDTKFTLNSEFAALFDLLETSELTFEIF